MIGYHEIACFFGGAFIANAVPHLTTGIVGRSLQTPFASPPFVGLSSPKVNVLWGVANVIVAYLLLRVGNIDMKNELQMGACVLGFTLMALQCARSFERIHRTNTVSKISV